MRLARSFCEGLLPGVPSGLWPPDIIPDMLQGTPVTCTRQPSTPGRHQPSPLRATHTPEELAFPGTALCLKQRFLMGQLWLPNDSGKAWDTEGHTAYDPFT